MTGLSRCTSGVKTAALLLALTAVAACAKDSTSPPVNRTLALSFVGLESAFAIAFGNTAKFEAYTLYKRIPEAFKLPSWTQ